MPDKEIINCINKGGHLAEKEYSAKLIMHGKGVGVNAHLSKIDNFETEKLFKLREKYAKSNKDLFARLLRNIDKIYSAKGGSTYYNLEGEKEDTAIDTINNVLKGTSILRFLKTEIADAFLYDPNAVLIAEIDINGNPYARIIASEEIVYKNIRGRKVKEVVTLLSESTKNELFGQDDKTRYYRKISSEGDFIFKLDKEMLIYLEEYTIPYPFSELQAIVIGDRYCKSKGHFLSPLDSVIELADNFLRDFSVKNIHKNIHGFPQPWEYGRKCTTCKGEGDLDGQTCYKCKGSKWMPPHDISEVLIIVPPTSKDTPNVIPPKGYIPTDISTWQKMDDDLKVLEASMYETIWGTTHPYLQDKETATGENINQQPINNVLHHLSSHMEDLATFLGNCLIRIAFNDEAYNDYIIRLGKRFLIESEDHLTKKYNESKVSGAPAYYLTELLEDVYYNRYENDSKGLAIAIKTMKLEPYVHKSIEEVKDMFGIGSPIYLSKIFFDEYIQSTTDMDIISKPLDLLRVELSNYAQQRGSMLSPLAQEAVDTNITKQ